MNRPCQFSNVTKDYLETFQCILDEMIQGMTGAELTDSISYNFIAQMIPHHQAAIEMSCNILNYTTNLPLQQIAEQIVTEQTKSIQSMREIVCCCERLPNTKEDLCSFQSRMNGIMQRMFTQMSSACTTNEINANFMREMIPHHMGAIEMSGTTLQYPICPELKPILDAIITSQKRGVAKMRRLLQCIRC